MKMFELSGTSILNLAETKNIDLLMLFLLVEANKQMVVKKQVIKHLVLVCPCLLTILCDLQMILAH
jgi:hypothetical protein